MNDVELSPAQCDKAIAYAKHWNHTDRRWPASDGVCQQAMSQGTASRSTTTVAKLARRRSLDSVGWHHSTRPSPSSQTRTKRHAPKRQIPKNVPKNLGPTIRCRPRVVGFLCIFP